MRTLSAILVAAFCAEFPAASCGGGSSPCPFPAPKASRVLGMHVGPAAGESYGAALTVAKSAGVQAIDLSFNWTGLETSPGVFDATWLDIANGFYPAQGVEVLLTLRPIDTAKKDVPADLASNPFDSKKMIARFNALLDFVFGRIGAIQLTGLAIGNEIDGVLGKDATLWSQFKTFYEATAAHARTLRKGLRVGTVGKLGPMIGANKADYLAINAKSDIVLATYYPLNPDFTFQPPAQVIADLDALVAVGYAPPIHIVELGYASGNACGSSEEKQRQFIVDAFTAWDKHAAKIASIYFSWLTDMSAADAAAAAGYYGLGSNAAFVEFLRTLGLRTHDGVAKPAFKALKSKASARSW